MDSNESDGSVKSDDDGDDSVKGEENGEDGVLLRSKRERRHPKKYGQDDVKTVTGSSKEVSMSTTSNDSLSTDEYPKKQFLAKIASYRQREYLINGQPQPRTFFKAIYRPGNHVNTEHMEAMLTCVWRRLSTTLLERRVVVLDTWFTQLLVSDHGRYLKARRGASTFNWNSTLRKYVIGEVSSRPGKVAWLVDVDRVFAPMQMGKDHWVSICIDLKQGSITVYDSIKNHNSESKVAKAMKPLTEIIPAILEEVSMRHSAVYTPASEFVYERPSNVSQNIRGGDCGPLSVKFIELSSQGLAVDGITDEMVSDIRTMYAIEVYNEFVEPIG